MAQRKSRTKIIVFSMLGLLLLAGIGVVVYLNKRDKGALVTVEAVQRRTIIQTVTANGKIQPETLVKVSSETSGEIIFLGAKEGDTVKKGQLLVRIKPDLVETQLAQFRASADVSKAQMNVAKAGLDKAILDLERVATLFKKEYSSKQELDAVKSAVEQTQASYEASAKEYQRALAALKQAEVSLSRTEIYSPMNGIVTSRSVELGEKVLGTTAFQGTEIMQIADLNVMNALVDVDENDVVHVKLGDTAKIQVDAIPDKEFTGFVYQIANSAKSNKAGTQDEVINFQIRIRFFNPDARFRPGMSCNADIQTDKHENVLSVPLQSVTVRLQNNKDKEMPKEDNPGGIEKKNTKEEKEKKSKRPPSVVFLNESLKAKMQKVETGISDNGYIEIKDGLQEGQVVVSGSFQAISKELEDGLQLRLDTAKTKKKW